jgi:transcriptional regulator with XRE-family HTH domain
MDRFRFGRSLRALRRRKDWRQQDLADAAKVSRSVAGRAERGEISRIAYGDLERLTEAAGGHLQLLLAWNGEALDRLLDEDHATVIDAMVRVYRAGGWVTEVEVSFSIFGERGSIDVFAWHPRTGRVAVNEIKATVPEAGRTVMTLDRKGRLAPQLAKDRGWRCTGVARILVLPATSTARRRIDRHRETFRTAFPAGTREALAWIADPSGPPIRGLIFLSDVRGAAGMERRVGRKRIRPKRAHTNSQPSSHKGEQPST